MARNGSGTYTLPEAPFVPLTTISSAAMNSDLSDIATALTGSLARDGQGGMTAVLPLNTSGFSYTNDTNTGMYRTGSDAQAIKCGGTDIVAVSTTGADVTGNLDVSGTISKGGMALLPIGIGPLPWPTSTAPSGWLLCYGQAVSRTTYAGLFAVIGSTYGSGDGSTTFNLPDMRGRVAPGADAMGGVAANRLPTAFYGTSAANVAAAGGNYAAALDTLNLPPYTPAGVITGGSTALNAQQGGLNAGGILFASNTPAFAFGAPLSTAPTFTGQAQGGASDPFAIIQPSLTTSYIIYAGV